MVNTSLPHLKNFVFIFNQDKIKLFPYSIALMLTSYYNKIWRLQTTRDTEELLPPPIAERSEPTATDEATAGDSATWPSVKFAKPALQKELQSQKKRLKQIHHITIY